MTKRNIQDMRFRIDVTMGGMSPANAAERVSSYFPAGTVEALEDSRITINDYIDREWMIEGDGDDELSLTLVTPVLAYEDTDEFLDLMKELQLQGAKGGEAFGMRLFVSTEDWPTQGIGNLANIISSRLPLLSHALCMPEWTQERPAPKQPDDEGMLEVFPGAVARDLDPDELKTCIQLGLAIASQAASQKWARAETETTTSDNEKYAFRCWMLRTGLKGQAYKETRMRLLRHLEGDASCRTGRAKATKAVHSR